MSGNLNSALLPVSGVGVQAILAGLPVGVVARAARVSLPFTGIVLGAYSLFALVLLIVGFVLRRVGRFDEPHEQARVGCDASGAP